jgi:hypothetical protein
MRIQSLFLTLAIFAGLFAGAMPASATVAPGTASVDLRNVDAGTQRNFAFTVVNSGSIPAGPLADPSVNWVRIFPADLDEGLHVAAGSPPPGWIFDITNKGEARFRSDTSAATPGKIGPGGTQAFTVIADADRLPGDAPLDWVVQVSDDNGQHATLQNATTPGALTTTIRALKINTVSVVSPAGVLDGTATANQQGVGLESVVANNGSDPLLVTPTLSSSAAGDSITSPAAATINPGESATFPFTANLGTVTNRTFSAGASAPNATALAKSTGQLAVETASAFAYKANTLAPGASSSGVSQTFVVALDKTNPPSVTFDEANTRLTFTKNTDPSQTFSTTLAPTAPTGRGTQTVGLQFTPVTIPGPAGADGIWTPSLSIQGTDDNGATVARSVSISNTFEIDNLVPVPLPTLSAPAAQVNEESQQVVKNGDTQTFGGQVKRGAADADPVDPTAVIVQCDLVVVNADFVEVNRFQVPISATGCRNDLGTIKGSSAPAALGVGDGWTRLEVAARDAAGNTSPVALSNYIRVDNVNPDVARVITGCGAQGRALNAACDDTKTVRAFFTEGVRATFLPADFTVAGNVVTRTDTAYIGGPYVTDPAGNRRPDESKPGTVCTPPAPTATNPMPQIPFCNVAILTLAQSMNNDATPATQYKFATAPGRNRAQDAPKNNMADWTKNAIDGIVPDLPSLTTVTQGGVDDSGGTVENPMGPQGGSFYSNLATPTFHMTGLGTGYTGFIAIDSNGSGDYEATDADVARCLADAAELDCTATTSLAPGTYTILVSALDPQNNLAEGKNADLGKHSRIATLVIDQSAPAATALSSVSASRVVTVGFDEPVGAGRNFVEDWLPFVINAAGKRQALTANTVAPTADLKGRDLTIAPNDPRWDGAADGLIYDFEDNTHQSTRYQDRAGNYLGDFTILAP